MAWAVMGICACGDVDRPSIQRGLRFLLSSQKPDGSWDELQITGTGFPRVFYLKYDMYRQNFPLMDLATYVNYRSGLGHRPSFYRCDQQGALRQYTATHKKINPVSSDDPILIIQNYRF